MFRRLPACKHDAGSLRALAETMTQTNETVAAAEDHENPMIPAGYTYLGQFIDHDLTFDPVSSLDRQNDPDALENFRTPRLDLDSVYGRGPADQPYLYDSGTAASSAGTSSASGVGMRLLLGETLDTPGSPFAGPDLLRNAPRTDPQARAIIGDPRNDENILVSQLHATFIKFHNRMLDWVASRTRLTGDELFEEAQRLVRWHYQWVVLHDFLPRIVGPDVLTDILRSDTVVASGRTWTMTRPRLVFYRWHRQPYMPIEFSVAAYRFGHSMVRSSYFINDFVRGQTNAAMPIVGVTSNPLASLTGFRPLPDKWGVQWKYFFDLEKPAHAPQLSLRIDTKLADPLINLPSAIASNPSSLALRNLLRGLSMGLPSGQHVARAMGIQPLDADQLGITPALGQAAFDDLHDRAPLWYYILREAEILQAGERLGPVGARIVAEVLVGVVAGDPASYLSVAPAWEPEVTDHQTFGMPELIRFAQGPAA